MLVPAPAEEAWWILYSRASTHQLVTFGPAGFSAYARVRYIPDPEFVGQDETDAVLPPDHLSDLAQARRVLYDLAPFTTRTDVCFFSFGPARIANPRYRDSIFTVSGEPYTLLTGRIEDIEEWAEDPTMFPDNFSPPAFAWPADHAWVFATDADPHWAGVGATDMAVDALLADSMIDAVRADPTVQYPRYS